MIDIGHREVESGCREHLALRRRHYERRGVMVLVKSISDFLIIARAIEYKSNKDNDFI